VWTLRLLPLLQGMKPRKAPSLFFTSSIFRQASKSATAAPLKLANNASSNAPPVIGDGWGDADEEWSDEGQEDSGWGSVYGTAAAAPAAKAPTTATPIAPKPQPPTTTAASVALPPLKKADAKAPASVTVAPIAAPQPKPAAAQQGLPTQPLQPIISQPQQPLPPLSMSKPVTQLLPQQPAAAQPPVTQLLPLTPAAKQAAPLQGAGLAPTKAAPASDPWGNFSFGSGSNAFDGWGSSATTTTASAAGDGDGWGDLSFLESKPTSGASAQQGVPIFGAVVCESEWVS
jgi:hypothetical protein